MTTEIVAELAEKLGIDIDDARSLTTTFLDAQERFGVDAAALWRNVFARFGLDPEHADVYDLARASGLSDAAADYLAEDS